VTEGWVDAGLGSVLVPWVAEIDRQQTRAAEQLVQGGLRLGVRLWPLPAGLWVAAAAGMNATARHMAACCAGAWFGAVTRHCATEDDRNHGAPAR
jgi:hypothetical protein